MSNARSASSRHTMDTLCIDIIFPDCIVRRSTVSPQARIRRVRTVAREGAGTAPKKSKTHSVSRAWRTGRASPSSGRRSARPRRHRRRRPSTAVRRACKGPCRRCGSGTPAPGRARGRARRDRSPRPRGAADRVCGGAWAGRMLGSCPTRLGLSERGSG